VSDELRAKVEALEAQVRRLEDTEAIRNLEVAYGYYLEHLMFEEVTDCWAENGQMEWTGLGVWKGKKEIRRQWKAVADRFHSHGDYLHLAPQVCPYITLAADGKTACGRWYVAGGKGAAFVYENTYVKEDGVWKIDIMSCGGFPMDMSAMGAPSNIGILGPEAAGGPAGGPPIDAPAPGAGGPPGPGGPPGAGGPGPDEEMIERISQDYMGHYEFTERMSRCPRQEFEPWIRPFSFKHPVTGKDVNPTVEAWNKANPCPMPPGGERWTENK
jgi:hypothetical protein